MWRKIKDFVRNFFQPKPKKKLTPEELKLYLLLQKKAKKLKNRRSQRTS